MNVLLSAVHRHLDILPISPQSWVSCPRQLSKDNGRPDHIIQQSNLEQLFSNQANAEPVQPANGSVSRLGYLRQVFKFSTILLCKRSDLGRVYLLKLARHWAGQSDIQYASDLGAVSPEP